MKNYFPKLPLHTLSILYVLVGFVTPPNFEAVYCFICGRRRMAVARCRMVGLVLEFKRREEIQRKQKEAIAEKLRKEEEKEIKRVEKLERYTERIICFGLWKTEQDVSEWVNGCLTSQLTIFQSYMWWHIDVQADWRRNWTYGRAPTP